MLNLHVKEKRADSVVLLYHRVGLPKLSSLVAGQYVAPKLLRSQLEYLLTKGWKAKPLRELVEELGNTKHQVCDEFAITFDDGYASVYEHAYPTLAEKGIAATIFVVAGLIGGINKWDSAVGDIREPLLNTQQIKELSAVGFEIGSHTLSHPHLTELGNAELNQELIDSKHKIEDLIGKEVIAFSYPYGDYDDRVLEAVQAAGYRYAVSTKLGVAQGSNVYEIPRVNVRWNAIGPFLMRKIGRAKRATETLG